MVNNMTMKKVNVFEIKAKLSEYLDLVEKGEQILICRRNRPVAELRAVAGTRSTDRPLGGTRLEIPQTFFEPLPPDFENAFYGETSGGEPGSKAAESRPSEYHAGRRAKRRRRA